MQLNTYDFGNELKKLGFNFYSGVPCSYLNPLINYSINESNFIMSTNEGDAVATCTGANITGLKSVVLMQNSGLTNATSPLTSLNYIFQIPILGFVSLRGEEGLNDEPQHELMGQITENFLDIMDIDWEYLSKDINEAKKQLQRANNSIKNKKTFFFIVKKDVFEKVSLKEVNIIKKENRNIKSKSNQDELPLRLEILQAISNLSKENIILLATTGKTGRELYEIKDRTENLYMVGSMGCISSLGLGMSLGNPSKKIISIDGDGAALMRMGNFATNGYYGKDNFLHILINNSMHDSTGGQKTVSPNIEFEKIASACGYDNSLYIHSINELKIEITKWIKKPCLTFMVIKAKKGTKENLGRPKIKPFEVANRLIKYYKNDK